MAILAASCFALLALGGAYVAFGTNNPPPADIAPTGTASPEFSPAPSTIVNDPAGDARDHSISYFNTGSQCRFGCGHPSLISEDIPQGVPGTVPVAWMDIVEGGFLSETQSNLQLVMRVSTLSEGFPELTPAPGVARGVDYVLCFGSANGERCATLDVVPQSTGPILTSYLSIFSPVCGAPLLNDARTERPTIAPFQQHSECAFEIPAEVTYGSPGSIVFDVPKAFAELDGPSTPWTHVRGNVSHFWLHPAVVTHAAASLNTDVLPHHHDHLGLVYPSGVADELLAMPTLINFAAAPAAIEPVLGPVSHAPPGLFYGDHLAKDPIFDLLETSIREDGADIVLTQSFAGITSSSAPDFEHMNFGRVENGPFFEFGAFHVGADWHAYAGRCIHFHCTNSTYLRLELTVIDGSPGQLQYRIPREYFGNPGPGTHLTFLLSFTQEVHPSYYAPEGQDNVHVMSTLDQYVGVLPYTFTGEAVDAVVAHDHDHEASPATAKAETVDRCIVTCGSSLAVSRRDSPMT